jgi:hypothetical protein
MPKSALLKIVLIFLTNFLVRKRRIALTANFG